MASESSFDIVSEVNLQEVDNAVNQAIKELKNRFDFKGSKSLIEFNKTDKKILLLADDEMKLRNLKDIVQTRLVSRGISMKALEYLAEEKTFEGTIRQSVNVIQGISQEKSKEIVRLIKDLKVKVQATIQGEKVRVVGKSKDDLQLVMQMLRNAKLDIALQFVNFRTN